jgi:hypothetical protein
MLAKEIAEAAAESGEVKIGAGQGMEAEFHKEGWM